MTNDQNMRKMYDKPLGCKARRNDLYVDSSDHSRTAQNVQSDLGSTLSDREIVFPNIYL